MKIIVGLGNPLEEYKNTRHNVGHMVIEKIAEERKIKLRKNLKLKAELSSFLYDKEEVVLAKSLVFMNESYITVEKLLSFYKIPLDNFLIVYDDMDLPLGKIKFTLKASSAGHKGIGSIINFLKNEEIPRLRVGISRPFSQSTVDYVLSEFSQEEKKVLKNVLKKCVRALLDWVKFGLNYVMQKYNRKDLYESL